MSGTVRVKCSCANEFQDKTYGKGTRIANRTAKEGEARCTVCGNLHQGKTEERKKK